MTLILTIDPGACTGWAVGTPIGCQRILQCGVVYPEHGGRPPKATAWGENAFDLLLIEKPVLTKVGPGDIVTRGNDLITCWGRGMLCAESSPHHNLVEVAPGTWKGQVDKKIHNARVLAKLTPDERKFIPSNHNAIDAVGLLLYAIERFYS